MLSWNDYCYILVTMKKNINKYETVQVLPLDALSVKEYAASIDCTVNSVYMKILRGKADFKIVTFQSFNFVVSL